MDCLEKLAKSAQRKGNASNNHERTNGVMLKLIALEIHSDGSLKIKLALGWVHPIGKFVISTANDECLLVKQ